MLTAEGLMRCIVSCGWHAHQSATGHRVGRPSHDAAGPQ